MKIIILIPILLICIIANAQADSTRWRHDTASMHHLWQKVRYYQCGAICAAQSGNQQKADSLAKLHHFYYDSAYRLHERVHNEGGSIRRKAEAMYYEAELDKPCDCKLQ